MLDCLCDSVVLYVEKCSGSDNKRINDVHAFSSRFRNLFQSGITQLAITKWSNLWVQDITKNYTRNQRTDLLIYLEQNLKLNLKFSQAN